jgi:uncharacterized protein YjiS (DUF1127 family)
MTDIAMDALNRGWNLGFATGRVDALRTELKARYARWRLSRTTRDELNQYSAAEIAELGISEADIDFIAADAGRR